MLFALSPLEILGGGALVVVAIGGLVWLVNRRAFRDLLGAGRAQVGKLGAAARNADPQAIIQQEIRDAQAELNNSITDLEESKGLVTELEEQVKQDNREVNLADSKVKSSLEDDPDDATGKAVEYIEKLETAQANLKRNNDQLVKARTIYANNLEKFRLAQSKIRQRQESARSLGQEVKSSETNARLAKLAQKFNVDVGALDSRLNEAEAEARRQIAKNNAVSEVQTDLGIDGLAEAREEERLRKASAKAKLAEYKDKLAKAKSPIA